MSRTENYNLFITDDGNTRFQDWRDAMSGESNSNMVKIDTALGDKANHSVSVSGILLSSAWSGIDSPFTQDIAVANLTENQNGTISVAQSATAEQRDMARCAMLSIVGQGDGTLTIAADGEMPDVDIPVTIILLY